MFGAATITSPARRKKRGAPTRKYDCGQHGKLTAREICWRAGINRASAYRRIEAGWRGEKLVLPAGATRKEMKPVPAAPRLHNLMLAVAVAEKYPKRVPTAEELQALRPMSRAQANAWRKAIACARRQAAA